MNMRKILLVLMGIMLMACSSKEQNAKDTDSVVKNAGKNEKNSSQPTLNVYNMGSVPMKEVNQLVETLQKVYPNTKFAGEMALVDSALIKNDPKGKNRYWWSKMLSH